MRPSVAHTKQPKYSAVVEVIAGQRLPVPCAVLSEILTRLELRSLWHHDAFRKACFEHREVPQ